MRHCRPRWFFLENVAMKPGWRDVISEHVGVDPTAVDAKWYNGIHRYRLYWTDIPHRVLYPARSATWADCLDSGYTERKKSTAVLKKSWDMWSFTTRSLLGLPKYLTSQRHPYKWSDPELTIPQKPTAEELERAMGLPVGYTRIHGATERQRWGGIGNGWQIDVIEMFFRQIPLGSLRVRHDLTERVPHTLQIPIW